MSEKLKVHLSLLAVNVIYGLNYNIAKLAMPAYILPYAFVLVRAAAGTLLFWMVKTILVKEKIAWKDMLLLSLCGLSGVAANQLLFFKGLSLTSSINSALIMITTPILVLVFAFITREEKITWRKSLGVLLGFAGAGLIILVRTGPGAEASSLLGDLYILLNAVAYAIYLVMVKPLMKRYNPLTVISWVFLFGTLMVLPFGYGELGTTHWGHLPLFIWLCIGFVVFFTTFLAYGLNIYALSKVNASLVGIYIYIQPFLAALIAVFVVGEALSIGKLFSGLLIFTGVYLVSRPSGTIKDKTPA
jgi:drug/metabolite transporter (DMT)-like permease